MTKHCSTIVPHTNFPSEFSYGKRHNISLKESANTDSQISSNDETSLNNNIKLNSVPNLLGGVQLNKMEDKNNGI
jgi:hypothetical protein